MLQRVPAILLLLPLAAGCGTTKWTDTQRAATEQLLISDSMDRAVSLIDFRALAARTVFLDDAPLKGVTDSAYLTSTMRQHMLACGCVLKEKKDEADYVVEIRAGAVGTDHHDLLYGVPAMSVPTVVPVDGFGVPSRIPEVPFVKKTEQRAVTKIACFAYNRQTGRPVWQSGIIPVESNAKAIWVLGAGPFQKGSIYEGTVFAGDQFDIPLVNLGKGEETERVSVADEAYFVEGDAQLARAAEQPGSPGVVQAKHEAGAAKLAPATNEAGAKTAAGPAEDGAAKAEQKEQPPQPAAQKPDTVVQGPALPQLSAVTSPSAERTPSTPPAPFPPEPSAARNEPAADVRAALHQSGR